MHISNCGHALSLLSLFIVNIVCSVNIGWKDYLKEQIQEYHDVPLQFEPQSKVTLLTGRVFGDTSIVAGVPDTFMAHFHQP